ncbi:D-glycero-beta-D-manno-heptose 1-phosphate adenylyltransferase [Candidatus Woesearchaeota archaeon]|nr:D-glycero-beta-D-manno-heptose 1-phosphate adenylyltransferase [Candidatus Woesearchaeota archaeon]
MQELEIIIRNAKHNGKKIVTTNGIFDILHIGHIRYLQEARKLGDLLIVALNSDASTRKLKGNSRPINAETDRAEVVAALGCVDYVTIFNEDNPIKILSVLKPDIHVKGGDYDMSQIMEKDAVEKNGGKIVLIPMVKGYSTSALIRKINK